MSARGDTQRNGESDRAAGAWSGTVALIVGQPGMSARLLAQHVDDGRGRCRVCSAGGQAGHSVFPCTLHAAAEQAQVVERERWAQGRRS